MSLPSSFFKNACIQFARGSYQMKLIRNEIPWNIGHRTVFCSNGHEIRDHGSSYLTSKRNTINRLMDAKLGYLTKLPKVTDRYPKDHTPYNVDYHIVLIHSHPPIVSGHFSTHRIVQLDGLPVYVPR